MIIRHVCMRVRTYCVSSLVKTHSTKQTRWLIERTNAEKRRREWARVRERNRANERTNTHISTENERTFNTFGENIYDVCINDIHRPLKRGSNTKYSKNSLLLLSILLLQLPAAAVDDIFRFWLCVVSRSFLCFQRQLFQLSSSPVLDIYFIIIIFVIKAKSKKKKHK